MLLKVAYFQLFLDLQIFERHVFVQKCRLADQSHQSHVLILHLPINICGAIVCCKKHFFFVPTFKKTFLHSFLHNNCGENSNSNTQNKSWLYYSNIARHDVASEGNFLLDVNDKMLKF